MVALTSGSDRSNLFLLVLAPAPLSEIICTFVTVSTIRIKMIVRNTRITETDAFNFTFLSIFQEYYHLSCSSFDLQLDPFF